MGLPYQNTEVPVEKTIGETMGLLHGIGFNKTAQSNEDGNYKVYAFYKNVPFEWSVNLEPVIKALVESKSNRTQRIIRGKYGDWEKRLADIQAQAKKTAWRLMYNHIKAVCDSIKLGVLKPADAFAGHFLTADKHGNKITLAQLLTQKIESGEINSPGLVLLESPK